MLPSNEDNFGLTSLETLGDSEELRAQAQEMLSVADDGPTSSAHHQGTDASDSIWVTVNARGRVENVEVSRRWRDRLDSGSFSASLFEAYTAAVQKSLIAMVRAAPTASDRSDGRQWSASTGVPTMSSLDPMLDEQEWLTATQRALDEIHDELDRLEQMEVGGTLANRERAIISPRECLTLQLQGSEIIRIDGDVQRIQASDGEQLRQEALAAFQEAQQGSDG